MSYLIPNDKEASALPGYFTGRSGKGPALLKMPEKISAGISLNEILIYARKLGASDVHLSPLNPVIFRQYGQLKDMTPNSLSMNEIRALLTAALPQEVLKLFERDGDKEYVHVISGYGRFRVSLMKQRYGWDLTARVIPMDIPDFKSTGLPPSVELLTKWSQGMVLVTGPAGCGKTTTLAVLVEMINKSRHDHIITIEQPIEVVYEPVNCQVTQREINIHSLSQSNALRAALREDPDVLVVSELRDLQTVQLAISASETGHLVFGAMNTVNAIQTISRVIDSFPSDEQPIIRNMISESLRGIICQQLIPRKDGNGMAAAYEVLIVNSSVSNLIRKGELVQINNAMMTGKAFGMVTMDASLEALAKNDIITAQDACERATNPATMAQLLAVKN